MRIMRILVLALAASATQATAADMFSAASRTETGKIDEYWHGIYVSIGGGFDANGLSADGLSGDIASNGAVLTGRIGYDHRFPGLVTGVFADVDWNNASGDAFGAEIEADLSYRLGAKVGLPINGVLPYVIAGWEWEEFEAKAGGASADFSPDGFFAGAGLEAALGGGFSVGVEASKSWADDEVQGIEIENDSYSVRAMVTKRFN